MKHCNFDIFLENFSAIDERIFSLSEKCEEELKKQGFAGEQIETEPYLHLRYNGTDCALMCGPSIMSSNKASVCSEGDFMKTFINRYQTEFGFVLTGRHVMVDDIRVRGVGKSFTAQENPIDVGTSAPAAEKVCINHEEQKFFKKNVHIYNNLLKRLFQETQVFFSGGYFSTKVYHLEKLKAGHEIKGPAVIMDKLSTILVEPDCTAAVTKTGNLEITIGTGKVNQIGPELDSIQLSIFSHRFMSIAEQMGR